MPIISCILRRLSTSFAMPRSTISAFRAAFVSAGFNSAALLKSSAARCHFCQGFSVSFHRRLTRLFPPSRNSCRAPRPSRYAAIIWSKLFSASAASAVRNRLFARRQRRVALRGDLLRVRPFFQQLDALGKPRVAEIVKRRRLHAFVLRGQRGLEHHFRLGKFFRGQQFRSRVVKIPRRRRRDGVRLVRRPAPGRQWPARNGSANLSMSSNNFMSWPESFFAACR